MLKTERLLLSEMSTADSVFILELTNTPKWLEYIGDRGIKTLDDAANYALNGPMKSYALNGFGLYIVKLAATQTAIGFCGLIKRNNLEDIDIGFAFLPQYNGKGYAFEAASRVLDFARNNLQQKRIVAITIPSNKNSIRLLEKLEMQFERMIRFPEEKEELMLFATQWA